MRKAAIRLSVVAAINLIFVAKAPLYADVIPSRPGAEKRQAKAKVSHELAVRGVAAVDSAQQVGEMSSRDLDYFGMDAKRVQLAAGLTWEEWVIGGVFVILLASVVAFIFIYVKNRD